MTRGATARGARRGAAPRLGALLGAAARDERGGSLIEALVASVLLGVALIVLMGSLSTLALASRQAEQVAVGQAVARAQAARIKAAPYQAGGDYSAYYEPMPAGLSRTVTTAWWDGVAPWTPTANASGLQRITLTITYGGSTSSRLEIVKADR